MKKVLVFVLSALLVIPCIGLFANAQELTNVAQGKKYTVDLCGGTPNYGSPVPDDGTQYGDGVDLSRQRLTDGVIGKADEGGASGLIGAQSTSKAIYVIDLGSVVNNIVKLNMDMYCGAWGIGDSISVEYAYSTDGTNYTNAGKVERANAVDKSAEGGWQGHDYVLNLTNGVSARYIQITAVATNYIWTSEMQVFAAEGASEESSQTSTESSESSLDSSESSADSSVQEPVTGSNEAETLVFAIMALAVSCAAVFTVIRKRSSVNG